MKAFALTDLPASMRAQLANPSFQVGHHSFTPHENLNVKGPGVRPCAVVQERQDAIPGPTDNLPRKAEVDGEGRPFYRITITLRTSDNRDRDADGAYSTLLDTYLFAVGRLLGVDRRALRTMAKGEERRRRGRHRNNRN